MGATGASGVSIFSQILTKDLHKILGASFVKKIDGCTGRPPDGTVQLDEEWEYFLNNFKDGQYLSIMKELRIKGFKYPYALESQDYSDSSLIRWADSIVIGIQDPVKKVRAIFERTIQPETTITLEKTVPSIPLTYNNGESEHNGELKFVFNREYGARPNGEKTPYDVFKQKMNGYAFYLCAEIAFFNPAVSRHFGLPNSSAVFYKNGDYAYLPPGKNRDALKTIEQIDNTDFQSHLYGYVSAPDGHNYFLDMDFFEETIKPLEHVPSERQSVALFYYCDADTRLGRGEYEKAVQDCKIALEITPDFALAHRYLAAAYKNLNLTAKAMAEFGAALRLDPDNPFIHYNLGEAYFRDNQIAEADRQFDIATRLNPVFAKAYFYLAKTHIKLNKVNDAVFAIQKAANLDGSYVDSAREDPDFSLIKDDPRFIAIINKK